MKRQCTSLAEMFIALGLGAIALCTADVAAQPRQPPKLEGQLVISGSSTMAPLITDIAAQFQVRHPGVKIVVRAGGSGVGIADVRASTADIGMASRALGAKEQDLRGYPIGRDGIAVLVHKSNAVADLTEDQMRAIFTGRAAHWNEVGGNRRAIVYIGRTPGRASTEVITHFLRLSDEQLKPHHRAGSNADLIAAIAAEPEGIAYVSVGSAERAVTEGVPIRLLRSNGIEPNNRNIISGDYGIARPLTLVTRQAPVGLARAFIDFALSPAAAGLLRKHDFIPYED